LFLRDPCATAKAKATRGRQAQDDSVVNNYKIKIDRTYSTVYFYLFYFQANRESHKCDSICMTEVSAENKGYNILPLGAE